MAGLQTQYAPSRCIGLWSRGGAFRRDVANLVRRHLTTGPAALRRDAANWADMRPSLTWRPTVTAGKDVAMDDMGQVQRGRRRRRIGLLPWLIVGALAGVAVPFWLATAADPPPAPPPPSPTPAPQTMVATAAERFLAAWEGEHWRRLQAQISDQSLDAAAVHRRTFEDLDVTRAEFTPGRARVDGDRAIVPFKARWYLDGLEPYSYDGTLRLERTDDDWSVRWWFDTVHPDLTETTRLERTRLFPRRGAILAADGTPLVSTRERVVVGVQPARIGSRRRLVAALERLTNADIAKVRRLLRRDDLDEFGFYTVTQLSPARFEAVRPQLYPVKGLVFRREQQRRRAQDVGRMLLGSLGDITAEQLQDLGEPYQAGDQVGQNGLERTFERRLAGAPAFEAAITDDVGLVRSLGFRAGKPPRSVRITLDIRTQRAAERVLRNAPRPAALVAIDASTGAVRAAASTPSGGFNRALSGVYPPGSAFKVITATAALSSGRSQRDKVACPGGIRIAGRRIRNAGGAAYGTVSLRRAFAQSCNTTFARLGLRAGAGRLERAAERFGFNEPSRFSLPAAGGSFPRPTSPAELARAAIGQSRVQASPLHMASVAAAAASGQYRPPTLLASDAGGLGRPLPKGVRRQLHGMMREVVRSGTGTAAQVRGSKVAGKTGSAQFDDGSRTHAWFIGYRDDLAFAVLVERGGGGGAVAAPIARDFLLRLDR